MQILSLYASEMLAMQKSLLEKSAAELLRTDNYLCFTSPK